MRRSKSRKREFLLSQVDFQQGLFSFWCILLPTWVVWSCGFSAVLRHQKHHISVILTSPPTCTHFWKLGLCSWITWSYRSRYPTSMTCGECCSHLIGRLEVHALHYPPVVRMAPVGDMGFLSGHQNHVSKMFVWCRRPNKLWQARLEKWSKEINSEQQSLQEWCAMTLQ